jgi:hypothetical protein
VLGDSASVHLQFCILNSAFCIDDWRSYGLVCPVLDITDFDDFVTGRRVQSGEIPQTSAR